MEEKKEFVFSFDMVFDFLKNSKWRIFLFAFLSAAIIILICFAFYTILPSQQFMYQEVSILLPKQGENDEIVYPSGKKFNRLDIVSPPVLKQVYENNNLKSMVNFDDFQKLFSVINFSRDRALLDADFASKLSKRNLSATDVSTIEREYKKAVAEIDASTYKVILDNSKIPPALAAKILNDTIDGWFQIYRKLEADKLPISNIDGELEKIIVQDLSQSKLIALDRFRYYTNQLESMITKLSALQGNRGLTISSGEYLEDITTKLKYITTYQLDTLRQMILNSQILKSDIDLIYVQGRLESETLQLESLQTRHKMLLESIDIVDIKNPAAKSKEDTTSFTLDANVLSQLATIYGRDASINIRKDLATQNTALASQISRQQSTVSFYKYMLDKLSVPAAATSQKNADAIFSEAFNAMMTSTVALSKKLTEFKELLINDYNSSVSFYSPVGEMGLLKDYMVPMKKMIAIAFVFWALLNAIYVSILFGKNYIWLPTESA